MNRCTRSLLWLRALRARRAHCAPIALLALLPLACGGATTSSLDIEAGTNADATGGGGGSGGGSSGSSNGNGSGGSGGGSSGGSSSGAGSSSGGSSGGGSSSGTGSGSGSSSGSDAGGSSGSSGNTPPDGGGCQQASDCHGPLPQLCVVCSNGSDGCAHWECQGGTCAIAYCAAEPDAGNADAGKTGKDGACTADGQCAPGLKCCYPCGTPGCSNECIAPLASGMCPMYP
jgi:hypothetical protein